MKLSGTGCFDCDKKLIISRTRCDDCTFLSKNPLARKKVNILYSKFRRNDFGSLSMSELSYVYKNSLLYPEKREEKELLRAYIGLDTRYLRYNLLRIFLGVKLNHEN